MAEKRTIEQITEDQQRKQQADEEKWREVELDLLSRPARPRAAF